MSKITEYILKIDRLTYDGEDFRDRSDTTWSTLDRAEADAKAAEINTMHDEKGWARCKVVETIVKMDAA